MPLATVQRRDQEKAKVASQQGLKLVQVPYWWDNRKERFDFQFVSFTLGSNTLLQSRSDNCKVVSRCCTSTSLHIKREGGRCHT